MYGAIKAPDKTPQDKDIKVTIKPICIFEIKYEQRIKTVDKILIIKTEDFSLTELEYEKIPEDMYLVLGDNRGDSLDSRDKKVGLIPKKNVIGQVRLQIWPLNEFGFTK